MKTSTRCIILFFLVVTSCKKAPNPPETSIFPVTVYAQSQDTKYNMRLFAGGIEITDPAKINKYAASIPASFVTTNLVSRFNLPYTFTSAESVKMVTANSLAVVKTNNKYVISVPAFYLTNPYDALFDQDKFFAYPTSIVPTTGGFTVTRPYAAYGDYTNFRVSVLLYKYRRPLNSNATAYGLIVNEFDASTVSKLGPSDSLAVQEFFVNYRQNN